MPCDPDGYNNTCVLINEQFPGPLLEANWGDWIEVKITNEVENEGTAIHWHGLLQKETPYMDGVPGNSQCPIAPGGTFTYRFRAGMSCRKFTSAERVADQCAIDLYGTSWYHSHWSAQYGSGLFGPIVFHGPKDTEYDEDLGEWLCTAEHYED